MSESVDRGVLQSEYKLKFIKWTQKKEGKFVQHDCFAVTNDDKQIDPRVAAQWKLSDEESQALVDKLILDRLKTTYEITYNYSRTEDSKSPRVKEFDSEYKRYLNDLYFEPSNEINLAVPPTAKREIEDETRDFLTTYSKDYRPKKLSKRKKKIPLEENFFESSGKLSLNTSKSTIEQVKIPVKTIYQYDFCSLYPKIQSKTKLSLPDDWIVPETVYKSSYRDCNCLYGFEWKPKRPVIEKPLDNLRPNLKEREILRVTTGDSEYAAVISETGKKFLK